MEAKILSYKIKHSKRKLLLIATESPESVIAIHLRKVFKLEDAQQIISKIQKGF